MDRRTKIAVSVGLALGIGFGLAGTFAPSASLRGVAWGLDGLGLVMASALLAIVSYKRGRDLMAAGFLVFLVAEALIVSGAAMDLAASVPSFGAGAGMWALGIALISIPKVFPLPVRLLGLVTSVLFMTLAFRIFAGARILPTDSPMPFYLYPFLAATLGGWIWALWRDDGDSSVPRHD